MISSKISSILGDFVLKYCLNASSLLQVCCDVMDVMNTAFMNGLVEEVDMLNVRTRIRKASEFLKIEDPPSQTRPE